MADGIRVLRILEYKYKDAETAARDMARWTHTIAPHPGMSMRTATLPFDAIEWDEPEEVEPTPIYDETGEQYADEVPEGYYPEEVVEVLLDPDVDGGTIGFTLQKEAKKFA